MPLTIGTQGTNIRNNSYDTGVWPNLRSHNDLCAVADFNNWRFALPQLGENIVDNPGFDTDTVWNKFQATISGGIATIASPDGTYAAVGINLATKRGSLYEISFDLLSLTGNPPGVDLGALNSNNTLPPGLGRKTIYLVSMYDLVPLSIKRSNGVTTFTIDNVSVREVLLTRNGSTLGPNLAGSGYTMSVNGGTGIATEAPSGQLNLTGDGTNAATGDKSFSCIPGRSYKIMYISSAAFGQIQIGTAQGGSQVFSITHTLGFNSYEFTATAATHWVRFTKGSTGEVVINSIDIREVPLGSYPKRTVSFSEFFTFTSSSTGRAYVGPDKLWKFNTSANEPRIDYRTGKRTLRIEPSGSNALLNYGDDPSNAFWTKFAMSVSADSQLSPLGTLTASRLTASGSFASFYPAVDPAASASTQYVIVARAKYVNQQYFTMVIEATGGFASMVVTFDLQAGTVFSANSSGGTLFTGVSGRIDLDQNGYYKCQAIFTTPVGYTTMRPKFWLGPYSGTDFSGTSIDLWDANMFVKAAAPDPIITAGAPIAIQDETLKGSSTLLGIATRPNTTWVIQGKEDASVNLYRQLISVDSGTGQGTDYRLSLAISTANRARLDVFVNSVQSGSTLNTSGTTLTQYKSFGVVGRFAPGSSGIDDSAGTLTTGATVPLPATSLNQVIFGKRGSAVDAWVSLNLDFIGLSPEALSSTAMAQFAISSNDRA